MRQDLRIMPAPTAPDGAKRWLIHDPVAGRFHRIGARAFELIGGSPPSEGEAREVSDFLMRNKLTRGSLPPESLIKEELAARPSLGQLLVHKYLFFRIPLFRPQRFLETLAPLVAPLFSRTAWIITALMGTVGLGLAARQWDAFKATFVGFLTLEGLIFYGITLLVLKALHELGHGFAAQRYGVRVPVIGVAFLVMFPVAYTETTEAWALTSRRKRIIIDAAGMLTEIMIACAAIFAWSFLPDGPGRQVAFFLATTSWTMSLLVNLNPCMRFDGYYLIGDALGVANLQKTGFGLGRWRMREALFGWRDPKPPLGDADGAGLERTLLGYAYATWVYRFFLFIGIAILVHHLFPKAIGIVLFCVEILMFIALPMSREFKVWWQRRAEIVATRRGRTTLALSSLALICLFAPLSSRVAAPALLTPREISEVFAPAPASVTTLHVAHGARVEEGDLLLSLASVSLTQALREAELTQAAARAQLSRAEATDAFRDDLGPLREGLARAVTNVAGLRERMAQLEVRAPISGRIEMQDAHLHAGRDVGMTLPLMRVQSEDVVLEARVAETALARIAKAADAAFVNHDGKAKARVIHIAPVSDSALDIDALSTVHGGAIMVDEDKRGRMVPREPVVTVRLAINADGREARGKVFIDAERRSLAGRIWRRVTGVLIRETDF